MCKIKDGQSVAEYFDDMNIMANQLAGYGEPIREHQQNMKIIENLPNSWKALKKNLRHNGTIHTLDDHRGHLRMEENDRIKENEPKKKNIGQSSGSKDFSFVVEESIVVSSHNEWWVDTGATRQRINTKNNMTFNGSLCDENPSEGYSHEPTPASVHLHTFCHYP
ncbi:hypothetical protein AMTR_s00108p00143570 [Amborella trichopoda]|uniref:Uncharacterized protein n=1 Tax=Amborella trichopoda TaxID=13333 RepID=W1NXF0_AMBTC|nr:hypothetical protein AMTR_s00108p00143570 [Amborella trichopoda]